MTLQELEAKVEEQGKKIRVLALEIHQKNMQMFDEQMELGRIKRNLKMKQNEHGHQ